jgi:hypothetical protein
MDDDGAQDTGGTVTTLELARATAYRRSQSWIQWIRHGSRMRMIVRDIHAVSLDILQRACDVSSDTSDRPLSPPATENGTFFAFDKMFASQMESTCHRANVKRMEAILVLMLTTLQDASVQCFCPYDLDAAGDDITSFRMEWSSLQCHAWPDVCSMEDVHVGMHLSRLRDMIEFMSRHLIAWTADAHFERFANDDAMRESGGRDTSIGHCRESHATNEPTTDVCAYWQGFAGSLLDVLLQTSSRLTLYLD